MRAVVVDSNAPARLTLRDVDAPTAEPSQALVRVAAISLNRGEVRRAQSAEEGWRPGWDLAGAVERAAADGSGPKEGARVVGLLNGGAWAETVAAPTNFLAELPDGVTFAQAATFPVAGLTALHVVEKGGSLIEQPVLITGASGGVGHFAVQIARHGGARVVGVVRKESDAAFVHAAGAHTVVVGEDAATAAGHGPFHLAVDSVGGQTLANVLTMLAPGGVCVNFGSSSAPEATINVSKFYGTGGTAFYGFYLFSEFTRETASGGLTRLGRLVADGHVRPHIAIEAPWTEIGTVAQQLLDRGFTGKAVLHLS